MNQYLFILPNAVNIATVAISVREAIQSLHATGERNWLTVIGNSEEAVLQREDYERMLEEELSWEKSLRLQMVESFLEMLKRNNLKDLTDADPNKPVYTPQIPAAVKSKAESKKQLQLSL